MKKQSELLILFLLLCTFLSCEKKIVDSEPLFKYQSLGNGKVLFTQQAKNATSFEWDFGDSSPKSNEENPVYQYSKNGDYNVILTAKNKRGKVSSTIKLTVSDAPKPITKFTFKGLGNGKIQFTNESENAESYLWNFGDGGTSTDKSPQHDYKLNGKYEIKLSAKNSNGTIESNQLISIEDAPKPVSKFSYKSMGNGTIQFTNESTNSDGYLWNFGENNSTTWEINPKYTYTKNGTYEVKLTAKNTNGENEYKQNITIADAPKPIADFSITYGSNGYVSFVNSSTGASSYQWTFGNGQTSTETNPSINYSANGNYSVTLTAKGANGENTIVKTVSITTIFVPTTGQLIFWSAVNKNIKIYVNGNYVGLLTRYITNGIAPSCGQQGFVTVTLAQGAYSFTAETDEFFATKWSGTINVTNGQCRSLQLTK